jgi:hypothetical protein
MVLSQDLNEYNKYLEISSYAVYLGISPKNFRIMVMHGPFLCPKGHDLLIQV